MGGDTSRLFWHPAVYNTNFNVLHSHTLTAEKKSKSQASQNNKIIPCNAPRFQHPTPLQLTCSTPGRVQTTSNASMERPQRDLSNEVNFVVCSPLHFGENRLGHSSRGECYLCLASYQSLIDSVSKVTLKVASSLGGNPDNPNPPTHKLPYTAFSQARATKAILPRSLRHTISQRLPSRRKRDSKTLAVTVQIILVNPSPPTKSSKLLPPSVPPCFVAVFLLDCFFLLDYMQCIGGIDI